MLEAPEALYLSEQLNRAVGGKTIIEVLAGPALCAEKRSGKKTTWEAAFTIAPVVNRRNFFPLNCFSNET